MAKKPNGIDDDLADLELSDIQRRFVDAYITRPNATQAAIEAGYSEKTAKQIGSQVRWKPNVAAAIERRMSKAEEIADIKAAEILTELKTLGMSNLGAHYFERDDMGRPKLRDWGEITDRQKAALKEVRVETEVVRSKKNPDEEIERTTIVLKTHDKEGPLHLLARYLRLLDDERGGGTTFNQQNTIIFADALSGARSILGNASGRGPDR